MRRLQIKLFSLWQRIFTLLRTKVAPFYNYSSGNWFPLPALDPLQKWTRNKSVRITKMDALQCAMNVLRCSNVQRVH